MRKHLSTLLVGVLAVAAFGGSAGVASARHGADDPAGHVRNSGADDGAGHVRHSGADDSPARATRRAHRRGRHGADDRAGHARRHGADDAPSHG